MMTDTVDLPRYGWGAWPEHLLTKKQLNDAGFQTGKKLPAPAGYCPREDSPGGKMLLYDKNMAVQKKPPTEAQLAALAKAKEAADLARRCKRCGYIAGRRELEETGGYCSDCWDYVDWQVDKDKARRWAARMLHRRNAVILDTETTGLHDAEIIQIAICDMWGNPLLNTLVKPERPERMYEVGDKGRSAFDVHGIGAERLVDAPRWPDIYPRLLEILKGKHVIIYNASFDLRVMAKMCKQYNLPSLSQWWGDFKWDTVMSWTPDSKPQLVAGWHDAMEKYSAWCGERRRDGSYRWQALGGNHDALGDCREVLEIMKEMAVDTMARGPKSPVEEWQEKKALEARIAELSKKANERLWCEEAIKNAVSVEKQNPNEWNERYRLTLNLHPHYWEQIRRLVKVEPQVSEGQLGAAHQHAHPPG